jgi:hypothetical protein
MNMKCAVIIGVSIILAGLIVAFAPGSRYQFGSSSGPNCFVLDTKDGRIWQGFVSTNSGAEPTWQEIKAPWRSPSNTK